MAQEQKQISAREFKEKVQAGYKKDALAKHFDIPVNRVTEYLQQLGLRIKATRQGGSILVMDLEETKEEVSNVNPNQTELEFSNIIEESSEIETTTSL